jgi:hypothetical protein
MSLKIFYVFTFCLLIAYGSVAQHEAVPMIGQPMPDLQLNNINHFKRTSARVSDFRGKWLILDYWARSCVTCIRNLSQMEQFQKRFDDQMQILLIGQNGQNAWGKGIEDMYERMRKLQNFKLPILYDSAMMLSWDEGMVPHIIVIDPKGIVTAITTGIDMTEEKLASMLAGHAVSFSPKDADPLKGKKRFSDAPRSYSSKISLWNGEGKLFVPINFYVGNYEEPGYRMMQAPLELLYKVAYTGTWYWHYTDSMYSEIYPRVVLEVAANSKLRKLMKDSTALFNYELAVPDSLNTKEKILSIMQVELKNVFGVNACLETREMPVWRVIALPGAAKMLKAKGDKTGAAYNMQGDGGAGGISYKNWPLSVAMESIVRYMDPFGIPLVDDTGITGNVDITLDAVLTDHSQVKSALKKSKLDIVPSTKKMLVLVIRDPTI